jgi:hypothetical protein
MSGKLEMEAEMQERRKQPRKDLMSYSQVFELYHGKLIGYLGDITFLGAMVIGEDPYEVGSELNISIQLPELPGVMATRMAMPVRVVHCQRDLSPEFYNIGLEFSLVTDQQKKIIAAIVDNYEFRRQTPNYPPRPA